MRPARLLPGLAAGLALVALGSTPTTGATEEVPAERPLVILFGGYGATEADMRLWAERAARHPRYGRAFAFEGIAYPNQAGSSPARAVAAAEATLAEVVSRVRARTLARHPTVVVGHSSGAALAVNVVARLGAFWLGAGTPVRLISLDAGLALDGPDPDLQAITHAACWAAAAPAQALVSFGYRRVTGLCRGFAHVLPVARCRTPVCLHFALVNRAVDPDLSFAGSRVVEAGVSGGYRDLAVELDWLGALP